MRRCVLTVWCSLVMVGVICPGVPAQEILILEPGDRVRVTAERCDLRKDIGTVISVSDGFLSASMNGNDLRCPISVLQKVELSARRREWWESSAKGFGIGAGIGLAILGSLFAEDGPPEDGEEGDAFRIAGICAAAGLVVGTLVGVIRGKDVWEEISVGRVHPTFSAGPSGHLEVGVRPFIVFSPDGGLGLGFSLPVGR